MAQTNVLLIELHRCLHVGCFCKASETARNLFRILFSTELAAIPANDSEEYDVTLQSCSLIEGMCSLFLRNVESGGQTCGALQEFIFCLQNAAFGVHECLLRLVLCKEKYFTYAASKALIACLLVNAQSEESGRITVEQWCQSLAAGLTITDDTTVNRLSFFEHFLIAIERQAKNKSEKGHCYSQNCSLVAAVVSETAAVDANLIFKTLQSKILLSTLIQQIATSGNQTKIGALHTIMRILMLIIHLEDVKRTVVHDTSPLFQLLTHEMPLLVWERVCYVLKEVIDYKSTMAVGKAVQEEQFKVAYHFLKSMDSFFWQAMPHHCGWHGFGGPFAMDQIGANSDRLAQADKPALQSFMLADLAFLATMSIHLGSSEITELGEMTQRCAELLDRGMLSTSEFLKLKVAPQLQSSAVMASVQASYLIMLFEDQDDALIEALLYLLEIWRHYDCIKMSRWKKDLEFPFEPWNPHIHFYIFVLLINNDYRVFLDFLISEETCFLLYLVKYLKFAVSDWEMLAKIHANGHCNQGHFQTCRPHARRTLHRTAKDMDSPTAGVANLEASHANQSNDEVKLVDYDSSSQSSSASEDETNTNNNQAKDSLSDLATVLNQLHIAIKRQVSKNIFPYNAMPLVKLLHVFNEKCESSCA